MTPRLSHTSRKRLTPWAVTRPAPSLAHPVATGCKGVATPDGGGRAATVGNRDTGADAPDLRMSRIAYQNALVESRTLDFGGNSWVLDCNR